MITDKVVIIQGNIVEQHVDAIVNAANTTLLGGGGVDGAIHRAAGSELYEACRTLGGCKTGHAKITAGYALPASWVIHAVGPVWREGYRKADTLLAACYRSCFAFVQPYAIKTIAFPAISTGAYRFPVAQASHIAFRETYAFLQSDACLEKVYFVCFDEKTYVCYSDAREELENNSAYI